MAMAMAMEMEMGMEMEKEMEMEMVEPSITMAAGRVGGNLYQIQMNKQHGCGWCEFNESFEAHFSQSMVVDLQVPQKSTCR